LPPETLAQNNLKSQLDVSFADVNVADAKLLLLAAQNNLQDAYAQLARALGTDQSVEYQLVDEPLPASLPTNTNALVAQAISTRPDVARLRFGREAAYKFAGAEADLARPTVSAVGVAGFLPYIDQAATTNPIPGRYEGAAVTLEIPVLNGGLFAARHTAAELRARDADQELRDFQGGCGARRPCRVGECRNRIPAHRRDRPVHALGGSGSRPRARPVRPGALVDR
jgi:outer membrane protein